MAELKVGVRVAGTSRHNLAIFSNGVVYVSGTLQGRGQVRADVTRLRLNFERLLINLNRFIVVFFGIERGTQVVHGVRVAWLQSQGRAVGSDGFFGFAGGEKRSAHSVVSLRKACVKRNCQLVRGNRFRVFFFVIKRQTSVAFGYGISGLKCQRLVEIGQRFVVLTFGIQRQAQIAQS